jgi:hypothetical protein
VLGSARRRNIYNIHRQQILSGQVSQWSDPALEAFAPTAAAHPELFSGECLYLCIVFVFQTRFLSFEIQGRLRI